MVIRKAKEQQAQQQAEKRNDFNVTVPAPNNSNNLPVQTNVQPGNVQQKDKIIQPSIQPSTEPDNKKPVTQQKVKPTIAPAKNE